MPTTTEKIIKPAATVQQKTAKGGFFRKAGDDAFFGKTASTFFEGKVQPKLTVSQPDDRHEKEAESTADKVMKMGEHISLREAAGGGAPHLPQAGDHAVPVPGEKLQRKEEEELQAKQQPVVEVVQRKEEEEKLDAKINEPAGISRSVEQPLAISASNHHPVDRNENGLPFETSPTRQVNRLGERGPPAPSLSFQQLLSSSKGSGSALPGDTRTSMESRFGADFGDVRVHTGQEAQQMSSQINAQAFTHGRDIYFASGKFSPRTSSGDHLLAHELTHTIQQGASPANRKIATKSAVIAPQTLSRAIDFSNLTGGSALPGEAKEYFENSFHASVDDIRIHNNMESLMACRSRHVRSFVEGRHIFFDPSFYSPESEEGGTLLARQIAESLKQRSINVPGLDSQLSAGIASVKQGEPAPKAREKGAKAPIEDKDKKKGGKGKKEGGIKGKKGGKKGKHRKGSSDDTLPFKPKKKDPKRSPASPEEDPAFLKVVKKTQATSKREKKHDPAESKAAAAQNAATAVPKEAESKAQNRKTDGMDTAGQQDKPFDAEAFKAELLKKIESITPSTLKEATEFKEDNKIGQVKQAMDSKVAEQKEGSTGPVTKASTLPLAVNDADNKHPVPLPASPKIARPPGPGAQDAAPKPRLPNEISLQEQSKSLDEEMKANNVTEDQLVKANEPTFSAAFDAKKGAQKDAVDRPVQYKKQEATIVKGAQSVAVADSVRSMAGIQLAKGKNEEQVSQHQQTGKKKDEDSRAAVAKKIEDLYQEAEKKVTAALEAADKQANEIFDAGSEAARIEFENYVDAKMRAYKRRRYSGFWGGLRWAKDKLFGMPDEVNEFYTQGRKLYLDKMDKVISQVATAVTSRLNEAKQAIKTGKTAIDEFLKTLPKDLEEVGKEAASNIQDKFDTLEQSINDKKDQLIDGLAKKYVDNVKKLDERISEMKEANKGLVDKAIGFLKKVWAVIKSLKELFTTILSKLASIIGTILSSPSGFFSNLGKAFKQGFDNFKANFLGYLEQGLMDWLSTNLGVKGLELPNKFNPAALFTLVLGVMGITKMHIRERAVALLGDEKVELLETAGGIIYRVVNEGPGAIWDMIVEKLSDLKEIIWEAIKSFIQKAVIEAALVFLLSLLSPIGAFVKVCMAIYDFLMMLVKFKDKIVELLDTVLNAVINIASGAIDGAAKMIEAAFAKSIPIIIAFLAALLHLNNVTAKVRDIITRIQKRVEKGIDFVIMKGWAAIGKGVEGALRIKQKGKEMVEKGKAKVVGAGKKVGGIVLGWLGFRQSFKTRSGVSHTMYIRDTTGAPALIIESDPKNVAEFFAQKIIEINASTVLSDAEKKKRLHSIENGQNFLRDVQNLMNSSKVTHQENPAIPTLIANIISIVREIDPGAEQLAIPRAEIEPNFSRTKARSLSAKYIYNGGGRGTPNHVAGGEPTDANLPNEWQVLVDMQLSSRWVKFHILNHNIGGVASDSNLVPTPSYLNNEYRSEFEDPIKGYYDRGLPVWLRANVTYRPEYNGYFAREITSRGGAMKLENNEWVEDPAKTLRFGKSVDLPQSDTYNINVILASPYEEIIVRRLTTVSQNMIDILRANRPAAGYNNVRQMERVLVQSLIPEAIDFTPEHIARFAPSVQIRNRLSEYRRGIASVNWTF